MAGFDYSEYDPTKGTSESYSKFTYKPYKSKYKKRLDEALDIVQNYGDFKYDYRRDPQYRAYKTEYENTGRDAMNDTMSAVASRTGGIASSYATAAGNQAYNQYMNELSARIPELRNQAFNEWEAGRGSAQVSLSALQGLDDDAYGRWKDNRDMAYANYQSQLQQAAQAAALAAAASRGGSGGGYGGGYATEPESTPTGPSINHNINVNDIVKEATNAFDSGYSEADIRAYINSVFPGNTAQTQIALLKFGNHVRSKSQGQGATNRPSGIGIRREVVM